MKIISKRGRELLAQTDKVKTRFFFARFESHVVHGSSIWRNIGASLQRTIFANHAFYNTQDDSFLLKMVAIRVVVSGGVLDWRPSGGNQTLAASDTLVLYEDGVYRVTQSGSIQLFSHPDHRTMPLLQIDVLNGQVNVIK